MAVNQWRTQLQASADISAQIVRNFGSADPEVLDELRFQVMPCPDNDSGKVLTCIAAYPRKEGAKSDKLMVALYG
jgi:hypothetical protein